MAKLKAQDIPPIKSVRVRKKDGKAVDYVLAIMSAEDARRLRILAAMRAQKISHLACEMLTQAVDAAPELRSIQNLVEKMP